MQVHAKNMIVKGSNADILDGEALLKAHEDSKGVFTVKNMAPYVATGAGAAVVGAAAGVALA